MSVLTSAPSPRLAGRRPRRRRTLISMTPLIDVVFILLIFFMLASSFLDWRSIALNAPTQAGAGSGAGDALMVEVRADGLRLSGEAISPDALAARIGTLLSADPDRRVLVKPAAGVALQEAVRVLDRLSAAGATDLSLIRDQGR